MTVSNLEKIPLKITCYIAAALLKKNFDFKNPYNDNTHVYYDMLEDLTSATLNQILNETLDLEFMAKFIDLNSALLTKWMDKEVKFNEIQNKLVIPKPTVYTVAYEVWGSCVLTEKYVVDWSSYDESFIDDAIEHARDDDKFNYWDGEYVEHETDNFEADNFQIDWVEKKKTNVGENKKNYSKMILEKSDTFLEQFDKKSLIKLRNLIDRKLNIL